MSTTGGISEIASDRMTHEPLNQTSTSAEDMDDEAHEFGTDNRTTYDIESNYHDEVAVEDAEELTERGSDIHLGSSFQPGVLEFGIIEEEARPSFKAICEELDKKNVVSHLQQCHSGPFVMNPPIASLRQQDIVVLNPRTGEVLGANQHAAQPIHAAQIDILKATNEDAVTGGMDQHLNGPDDLGQQPGYEMQQNGNTDSSSRGGKGAGASDEGSGNANGGSHPIHTASMERARQTYNMSQCQLAHVTVYLDRALICRRIRPRFKASEITEVLFEHLSPAIDKDSVRVEIRGAATILDVSYAARSLSEEEDTWTHTVTELVNELRQCQRQHECLSGRIARTSKQRLVLDTFADNLIRRDEEATCTSTAVGSSAAHPTSMPSPVSPTTGAPSPALSGDHKSSSEAINPYDPRHMDTLHRFLGIYEEQAERLDSCLLDANEELDHVQARMEVIEKELHEIELKQDQRLARELSVLVEPRETGQVEMLISYVVSRCAWKPAYDIRIFNSDGTMKIVYYGMVQQATGEDWETRSMSLSTTTPGTGGTVPHLGLQRVHFKKDHSPSMAVKQMNANSMVQLPPLYVPNAHRNRSQTKMGFKRPVRPTTTSFHEAERILNDLERDTPTPGCTLQRGVSLEAPSGSESRSAATRTPSRRALGASMLFHVPANPPTSSNAGHGSPFSSNVHASSGNSSAASTATGSSNIATVHLDVPRPPALVRCDNEPVRVTVGLLDLQPRYEYVTVPKRALYAYLKATAVNRSEFLILAGQTNIYADNTFIGKSELPPVAQGEEFSCNLGSEHGIKVFYRPLFKYREGTGSGGKHTTLTFKQLIEVRNSFDRSIRLTVIDQVPVSGEDKIKITLLEPVIKHPEKYDRNKSIRMNKSNNVEWDLDLGPGETKELTLKYSIEHPATEDLDVSVTDV